MISGNPSPLSSPIDATAQRALDELVRTLSTTQIAWVSGYLARFAEQAVANVAEEEPAEVVTILYGSQGGNTKGLAEQLHARAQAGGIGTQLLSMAELAPRKLAKLQRVILLTSTHGEGEPPESAYALHAFVMDQDAPRMELLQFAVIGLGDSSYERYCQTAVDFDRRLAQLGARRMLPLQCCDVEYEADAQRWQTDVLGRLAALAAKRPAQVAAWPRGRTEPAESYTKENPYAATLLENRRITTLDAVAEVRHLALGVEPRRVRYRPGDTLGVCFRNDPVLVDSILERLGLDASSPVSQDDSVQALGQVLTERLELTQVHPTTVRRWSDHAQASRLQAIVADPAKLRNYARRRQLIDLIMDFPASIDADALIELLPRIQPRLYSIASSQAEIDDEIHLTLSVVRYRRAGEPRLGGASGFLAERLRPNERLAVYPVDNPSFHLPTSSGVDIIMIGAGTGIAPYRGFLQERAATGDRGRNWLLFGNRHFHRDFLYQLDWQAQRKAGLLHRASLAFSRDGAGKVYVQDRLRTEARELFRWLEEGAHLYVCGATEMGEAVHQALIDVAGREGGLQEDAATDYIDTLRREARYHRDLY